MKTFLLILGIIFIITAILSLAISGFFFYARMHTYDGSADLYARQAKSAFIFLIAGIILLVLGIVCLVVRNKI